MAQTTNGPVNAIQNRRNPPDFVRAPSQIRHCSGTANNIAMIGLLKTINGAATTISSSCCVMCAENKTSPSLCKGESSERTSTSHPDQKDVICQLLTPGRVVFR